MTGPQEDDSEDLHDEEIAKVTVTASVKGIIEFVRSATCPECSVKMTVAGHELRRRKPHLYWRMQLRCPEGHEGTHLFQVDWVNARG